MSDLETAIGPDEILRRLPHRYPFLLVDRAERYVPGESIVGFKCVSAAEPHFQGHFPENPVMPGVLIIEAMAQTGAILMSKTLDADISNTLIYFMGVEQAKFRRPVRPGDVLEMPVEVTANRRGVFKFKGEARVNGVRCADATFSATSAPREA
ncbi:MAG: 3-hydroxyacyl-[acyl-carrier-protein] dehydratase FabZ [Oceanicaulis sp.]|jgi:3-hydroxyacyl-[acyl-carrier-protein] dehydratase|uniref:3-hydroxyacyl-ACP dehydratase FabZ n=1 Tax=unclassified Oceanicaulis TaxID=2632123 RepID=UPI000066D439|nr:MULTISPECIES: 3-hydroxyacyl-ACP dehydratase FabZ [unclassified Oceanicaulis]EAP91052.1 (3R)-hydroxymyristoyl-(acyl-carrier-protein) dehydratase [Oceanicaulis sp. HTCC2633]MAB69487.1 3-hydroxyacyl-[acyl-carrier-protein] dehydratase FabZ [Oceanicaulis sp.]MBC39590.1 3-hydroxyacyl-[acyl-carrier-protein] dehydratase FabZ [Oceanicaulis sp.]MBG34441.1 3-hydroxyacyl-[acyl-carrier-protein] dehydratase FabZ [Oceanicaulis sp.]HBU63156.1 3-hydroxyacyl-[acyl-carrier-protein] dehydratase FabZ [Oceanicau|tara:strand:+ start:91 stop:549 length:459 start_codon:yes stop_codon:yes gene_type:complete